MSTAKDQADTFDATSVDPGWPAEAGLVAMSLAAAVGMGRLFADASFLPVVLLAVVLSHGVPLLCRRTGVGPLGTLAVSAVGLVLFVTWVIEPHVSLVPSLATWQAASVDLREAWGRFSEVVAPARVTRGFLLGAVLGSWVSSFVADLFAFRARTRLEAVVPSFTVFLFGALLGSDRHRLAAALLYLGAVLAFVVLAEISAAPRARPWLSGGRRPGERALLRSGVGMGALALVLAVVVGPQLPGAGAQGVLGVADGNGRKSGTRVTLSPLVDIRGRLVGQSTVELFTVATETPTYWRITSLDRFDGTIWSSLSNYRPAGTRLPSVGADASRGGTTKSTQEFEISGLSSIWLPAAYRPERLSPSGKVRFDPDSGSLATDKATSDGLRYTVNPRCPASPPRSSRRWAPAFRPTSPPATSRSRPTCRARCGGRPSASPGTRSRPTAGPRPCRTGSATTSPTTSRCPPATTPAPWTTSSRAARATASSSPVRTQPWPGRSGCRPGWPSASPPAPRRPTGAGTSPGRKPTPGPRST